MSEIPSNLSALEHVLNAVREGRAAIDRDPFPHLVVENVLPDDLYATLEGAFPETGYIAETDAL